MDVWCKVDHEGGIYAALSYGLKASDMPDAELEAAWQALSDAFGALQPKVEAVMTLLDDAYDDYSAAEE